MRQRIAIAGLAVALVLSLQHLLELRSTSKDQEATIALMQSRYKVLQNNVKEVTENANAAKQQLELGKQESTEVDRNTLASAIPDAVRDRLCQHLRCTGSD